MDICTDVHTGTCVFRHACRHMRRRLHRWRACMGMSPDVCADIWTYICEDVCADKSADIDMRINMFIDMRVDCYSALERLMRV